MVQLVESFAVSLACPLVLLARYLRLTLWYTHIHLLPIPLAASPFPFHLFYRTEQDPEIRYPAQLELDTILSSSHPGPFVIVCRRIRCTRIAGDTALKRMRMFVNFDVGRHIVVVIGGVGSVSGAESEVEQICVASHRPPWVGMPLRGVRQDI